MGWLDRVVALKGVALARVQKAAMAEATAAPALTTAASNETMAHRLGVASRSASFT